jgi:HK97 family phage portal protein
VSLIKSANGLSLVEKLWTEEQQLAYFFGDSDLALSGGYTEAQALASGFELSTWAFASINLVAAACASVPWVAETLSGEAASGMDLWEPDDNHALTNLIKRPNQVHSRVDYIIRTVYSLMLTGNALSIIQSRGGMDEVPTALLPMKSTEISPVIYGRWTDGQVIQQYTSVSVDEETGGPNGVWETDEVLHVMFQDPDRIWWGHSPYESAMRTIQTDSDAVDWNRDSLRNRAVSDGIFSFEQHLSEPQYREALSRVQENWQVRGRRPFVLGAGADYKSISLTPVEMDFNQSRKTNLTEIAAAFGVLPAMFAPDAATFSNLKEARRALWIDTVIPILELLQGAFQRQLVDPFYNKDGKEETRIVFDISNVEALKDNLDQRATVWSTLVNNGIPVNVASQHLQMGMPRIEGGDEPHGLRPVASQIIRTNPETGEQDMRNPEAPGANREPGEPEDTNPDRQEEEAIEVQATANLIDVLEKASFLSEDEKRDLVLRTMALREKTK